MQTDDFCQALASEIHRNKLRCTQIDEAKLVLDTERRALKALHEALGTASTVFEASEQVVHRARTRQARLNPVALYQSAQNVVDEVLAARARSKTGAEDASAG